MEEIINEMDGLFKQVVKYYPMKDLAETKRQWNSLVSEFKNCKLPCVTKRYYWIDPEGKPSKCWDEETHKVSLTETDIKYAEAKGWKLMEIEVTL